MGERLTEEGAKDRPAWPAFTLHHATVLLIASFNHSQGSENVQDWLLEYLHRLHPDVRIAEAFKNEIKACVQPIVHRLLAIDSDQLSSGHQPISRDEMVLFLDKETYRMQETFNKSGHPDLGLTSEELLARIATDVVERDHHWTVTGLDARPNRRRLKHPTSRSPSHWIDPHYSYVVEHGLKGRPTEAPEFDHLYAQLGERYRRALLTTNDERTFHTETYSQLLKIIHRYNRDHPHGRVFISKLR